jgi:N6-adenosine-specific RNA methylase IME4
MSGYRTIVADPPWPYEGFATDPTSGRGLPASARRPVDVTPLPYRSMEIRELRKLRIRDIARVAEVRLFLWATNRYLPDSFGLLRDWGFIYKQTVVWHKTGNPSPFGGSIAPNHAEFLLVACIGDVPLTGRLPSSVIAAPAQRQHSRKPDVFLDLVEQVSPGPYLELFARRQRLGWDTWGDEALNHVDLSASAAGAAP